MIRRLAAACLLAATVLIVAPTSHHGLIAAADASVVDIAGSTPDDAGHSIGSPDAGPKPEHSGDRGGWAQLSILGILAGGVGFIMWRIFHEQPPEESAPLSR